MEEQRYDKDVLIEQYKQYIQDVGNIGLRHENTRRFYLSVVSALFVFLSLAGSDGVFSGLNFQVQMVIGIVGIFLSEVWRKHMISFGALYKVKFDVLREIEKAAGLYPIYEREEQLLFDKDADKEIKTKFKFLTRLDSLVPRLFEVIFVIVIVLKNT